MHIAGHYYHVYNRGVNRQLIFANDDNYGFLLLRAKSYLRDYALSVIAYCLMPNHYHFLLRPEGDEALSRFIQRLFNSCSQAFNRQQGRSGTLFEGRAKSILVDEERYILHLCRYIHWNPVRAQLVEHPSNSVMVVYLPEKGKGMLRKRARFFVRPQVNLRPAQYLVRPGKSGAVAQVLLKLRDLFQQLVSRGVPALVAQHHG